MGCFSDVSRACSALLLMVINAVLLAGGILILYGGIHARHSGWLDVVDAHWSGAKTILTVLEVIGGVIIGLAVLGSIAACCRWRAGLLIYAFLIALVLVLFIVIAVFAFSVRSTADDWKNKTYPAANDETTIKTEFDRAYCYAQGAYICNDMAISDAAAIFYPTYANTSVTSLFGDLKGLNAICSALGSSVPSLKSVCQGCAAAKQAENLTSILNWANDKCPRTRSTLLWCGTFLGESQSGNDIAVGTAPYTQCRPAFLDLVRSSALTLGIGSVIICAGALLVIIFACVLRCRERREARYEDTSYGAQQATTTPQTNAPYYVGQQQPTDHLYSSKV